MIVVQPKPVNQPSSEINCVEAGKNLKHEGRRALNSRIEKDYHSRIAKRDGCMLQLQLCFKFLYVKLCWFIRYTFENYGLSCYQFVRVRKEVRIISMCKENNNFNKVKIKLFFCCFFLYSWILRYLLIKIWHFLWRSWLKCSTTTSASLSLCFCCLCLLPKP